MEERAIFLRIHTVEILNFEFALCDVYTALTSVYSLTTSGSFSSFTLTFLSTMRFAGWFLTALAVPPPDTPTVLQQIRSPSTKFLATNNALSQGVSLWLADSTTAAPPPSKEDIQLLRQAFAEFYGVEQDLVKSEDLLSQTIEKWQNQPADELAGLYRVRGDCYMLLQNAAKATSDYQKALELLDGPGKNDADPAELPLALLGRARAIKSQGSEISAKLASQAASDYERALKLSSREEWDTDQELLEDGATRNPYAAWEWGSMLRLTGQWQQAATAHALAATAFDEIGDKARSVISLTDAGIDLAAADKTNDAKSLLRKTIPKTKGIEASDVGLLQRVVAKEGEGRMALASLLWDEGQRQEAETILGDACIRLDQLQADAARRKDGSSQQPPARLRFSIDDEIDALDVSCSKFRNPKFLTKLGWPEKLQKKVIKLETLR